MTPTKAEIMDTICAMDADRNSDLGLLADAKCGDMKAFGGLVKRYNRKIFAVANRMMKNREDAEDVVQESLLKAFVRLDTFRGQSQFSTWLTRIAMNEALMLLRRRRRALEIFPTRPDEDAESTSEVFIDSKPSPEECYLRKERTEVLTDAVNRLSAKSRQTILLLSVDGSSVEQVAKTVGISTAAAKSRLFHGYERLRQTMNPELLWGVGTNHSAGAQRI